LMLTSRMARRYTGALGDDAEDSGSMAFIHKLDVKAEEHETHADGDDCFPGEHRGIIC
jgi:hypothetical protein